MKKFAAVVVLSLLGCSLYGMKPLSVDDVFRRFNDIITRCVEQDDELDDLEDFLEQTKANADDVKRELPDKTISGKTIGEWLEETYLYSNRLYGNEDISKKALQALHRVEVHRKNKFMDATMARDVADWLTAATLLDTDENVLTLASHCLTSNARHPEFEMFLRYTKRDFKFIGQFPNDRSFYEQVRVLPTGKAPLKKFVLEQLAAYVDPVKAAQDKEFNDKITICVEGKGGFGELEVYLQRTKANADEVVHTGTGKFIGAWLEELHKELHNTSSLDASHKAALQNVKKVLLRVSKYRANRSYTDHTFERAQADWLQPGSDTDEHLAELLGHAICGAARFDELKAYLGKAIRAIDIDKLSYQNSSGTAQSAAQSVGQTLDECVIKNDPQAIAVLKLVYKLRADKDDTLRALIKAVKAHTFDTATRTALEEWYMFVESDSMIDKIPIEASKPSGDTIGKVIDDLNDPSLSAFFKRVKPNIPKGPPKGPSRGKPSQASESFITKKTFALVGTLAFFAYTFYRNYSKKAQDTKKAAKAA